MAGVRNLDMLIPGWVDITTAERVYHLRDDVGALIGFFTFRLAEMERKLGEELGTGDLSVAEIAKRYADYEREVLEVCGHIFRATPEFAKMTDAEVGALLSPMQRMELIKVFFTIRSNRSQTPASAPDASATASTSMAKETTPGTPLDPAASRIVTDGPSGLGVTRKRKRS